MRDHLSGKTVIITGAGDGIGRAYAVAMAAEGARIIVNDITRDASADTVDAIGRAGGLASIDQTDVSDFRAAEVLIERSVREFGEIDGLINNAAIEFRRGDSAVSNWDSVMAVNARGSFNCAYHVSKHMKKQGRGAIVNTTSAAFWDGTVGVAAYAASKAAIFSLTLSLHSELSPFGVTCNCIAPDATRTRMIETWIKLLSAELDRAEEQVIAERGIQSPENLAPLAIYLCSDAGRSLSGRIFEVSGDKIYRCVCRLEATASNDRAKTG